MRKKSGTWSYNPQYTCCKYDRPYIYRLLDGNNKESVVMGYLSKLNIPADDKKQKFMFNCCPLYNKTDFWTYCIICSMGSDGYVEINDAPWWTHDSKGVTKREQREHHLKIIGWKSFFIPKNAGYLKLF